MAKRDRIKLPKRVGGVKIPKVIRKGPLGEFLNSHAGRLILGEALVAAAAIFTATKTDDDSAVAEGLRHPVDGARRLGNAMALSSADHSERLGHACREAGRTFRETLHAAYDPLRQDRRDIGANGVDGVDEDEAHAKKKSSGRDSLATKH